MSAIITGRLEPGTLVKVSFRGGWRYPGVHEPSRTSYGIVLGNYGRTPDTKIWTYKVTCDGVAMVVHNRHQQAGYPQIIAVLNDAPDLG